MLSPTLDLNDLHLFAQVVQWQGFSAAARALGIPKSRISRRIALLEDRLQTRLLQRSSRHLNLTEAGKTLYAHCIAMVDDAMAGEQAVRSLQQEPSGEIRLSVPLAISDAALSHLLPRFLQRYPGIKLSVEATNREVNLLEEGIDVVVRGVGFELESSSLVQSGLCSVRWGLVASPQLLNSIGQIQRLQQLQGVPALLFATKRESTDVLRVMDADGLREDVSVTVRLHSDNIQTLKQAAIAALGVASLPLYSCAEELAAGSLCWILPQYLPKDGRLVMLYPSRRGLSASVRALIDFIKAELPDLLAHRDNESLSADSTA
jgi:DNA-binding transcriptional LysR family regulator